MASGVGRGPPECFDGYKDEMRTTRLAVMAIDEA